MKTFLPVIITLGLACATAWAQVYTVDLSQDETLLPFFKAGLHPRNERADSCKLPNQTTVILDFGEVKLPPITADWSISVQGDDRVYSVKARLNRLLTKEEAKKMGAEISVAFGKSAQEVIDAVDGMIGLAPPQGFRHSIKLNRGKTVIYIGYDFNGSEVREKPLLILFSAGWSRPRKEIHVRTIPIKPPPGYEHLSMAPDRSYDGTGDLITQEIHEIVAQRAVKAAQDAEAEKAAVAAQKVWRDWSLLVLMLLGFGGLILYILRRRAKRNSPMKA